MKVRDGQLVLQEDYSPGQHSRGHVPQRRCRQDIMAGLSATRLAVVRYKTNTEQCHFKQNQNNGCLQATNRPSGVSQRACWRCASLNDKPGQEAITRHDDPLVFTNGASRQVPASAKVMPTTAEKINLMLVTSSIPTIYNHRHCSPAICPGTITRNPSYRAGSQCRQVLWPMWGNLAAVPLKWKAGSVTGNEITYIGITVWCLAKNKLQVGNYFSNLISSDSSQTSTEQSSFKHFCPYLSHVMQLTE